MPFTFAHPAAILPLSRWCPRLLNLPALIVGSMVPDLGYYCHNWIWSIKGHSFVGIVTFDVPAGLLLLCAFYLSVRPLAELVPSPHKEILLSHAPRLAFPGWKSWAVTILSLIAGASTHIVWDGFTHANGWCVSRFAALTPTVFSIGSYNVTVWQLLQHASTAAGLFLLLHYYSRYASKFPAQGVRQTVAARCLWLACLLLPGALAAMSSLWAFRSGLSIPNFDVFVFNFVVTFVCLFMPSVVIAGSLHSVFRGISLRAKKKTSVPNTVSAHGGNSESSAVIQ